jgi:hypothetical protein
MAMRANESREAFRLVDCLDLLCPDIDDAPTGRRPLPNTGFKLDENDRIAPTNLIDGIARTATRPARVMVGALAMKPTDLSA